MTEIQRCVAIEAQFAWFSQQCSNDATTTVAHSEYPTPLPVCDEHAQDPA